MLLGECDCSAWGVRGQFSFWLGWLGLVNAERNAMSDIIFYAVLGFACLALVDYVGCVGRR